MRDVLKFFVLLPCLMAATVVGVFLVGISTIIDAAFDVLGIAEK